MHPGLFVFITGLPSSGKSAFAERAAARLRARGYGCAVLDGDAVRACIVPELGYSELERQHFYATLTRLAALLAAQGLVVLVAATANLRSYRDQARARSPRFLEVWIDTPLATCVERDSKGLYAANRSGQAETVPGPGVRYEAPTEPEITAHGGLDDQALEELVTQCLRLAPIGAQIPR